MSLKAFGLLGLGALLSAPAPAFADPVGLTCVMTHYEAYGRVDPVSGGDSTTYTLDLDAALLDDMPALATEGRITAVIPLGGGVAFREINRYDLSMRFTMSNGYGDGQLADLQSRWATMDTVEERQAFVTAALQILAARPDEGGVSIYGCQIRQRGV